MAKMLPGPEATPAIDFILQLTNLSPWTMLGLASRLVKWDQLFKATEKQQIRQVKNQLRAIPAEERQSVRETMRAEQVRRRQMLNNATAYATLRDELKAGVNNMAEKLTQFEKAMQAGGYPRTSPEYMHQEFRAWQEFSKHQNPRRRLMDKAMENMQDILMNQAQSQASHIDRLAIREANKAISNQIQAGTFTATQLQHLTDQQLKYLDRQLTDINRKRYKRLEQKGLDTGAMKAYRENKLQGQTPAGASRNERLRRVKQKLDFYNAETGSVSKYENVKQRVSDTIEREHGFRIKSDTYDSTWKAYEEIKKDHPEVATDMQLKYKLLGTLEEMDSNLSFEEKAAIVKGSWEELMLNDTAAVDTASNWYTVQ